MSSLYVEEINRLNDRRFTIFHYGSPRGRWMIYWNGGRLTPVHCVGAGKNGCLAVKMPNGEIKNVRYNSLKDPLGFSELWAWVSGKTKEITKCPSCGKPHDTYLFAAYGLERCYRCCPETEKEKFFRTADLSGGMAHWPGDAWALTRKAEVRDV
jgi:hypothetical protein